MAFFKKIRSHQHIETDPEEIAISLKERHTFFTSSSSDSEASGADRDEDLSSQIEIEKTGSGFEALDVPPTDLSIKEEDLKLMMERKSALPIEIS